MVHRDNAVFDQKLIRERLEQWVATLVHVKAPANSVDRPSEAERVIIYDASNTTGELRYPITPVADAKFVENGKESPGNVQSLDIQISEHRIQ